MSDHATHFILEQRRHRLLNTVHTWLLAGGSLALLAVTAWVFGGLIGVILAIIFGGASMLAVGRISPRMVLSMYKAEPVPDHRFPEGVRIVRELARRAGLPAAPALYVVPSNMMNAFAVGRRDDSAIAVTDALVRRLSLREFAGVLAHEMSHIAHEDVRVMAFADMVSRYTSIMSTVGIFSLFVNIGSFAGGYGTPVPWLAVLVLVFAPTVGGLLQLALSRTREFDADLGAAMLTGDPDGLAMALTRLERAQRRGWETLMLPGGRVPDPSILRSHPPTAERIARLMALKGQAGPGRPDPGAGPLAPLAPLEGRHSLVPRVRQRVPLVSQRDRDRFASLAALPDFPSMADEAGTPARDEGLSTPRDGPRIRLRRGGVWW